MRSCVLKVLSNQVPCQEKKCRYWNDFKPDLNCTLICVHQNGALTLAEISKRLKMTPGNVSQIEKNAVKKLNKTLKKLNLI